MAQGYTLDELNKLPDPPQGKVGYSLDQVNALPEKPQPKNPLAFVDAQQQRIESLPTWRQPAENLTAGFAKGAVSTVKGLGTVGQKIGNLFLPKSKEINVPFFTPQSDQAQMAQESLKPKGFAQGVGNVAEKIVETTIPVGKVGSVSGGMGTVDTGIKTFMKTPALASLPTRVGLATARTGTRVAAEAIPQYGLGYIQSGGDAEAAKAQALTAGLFKGATAGIGEALSGTATTLRPYIKLFGKDNYSKTGLELAKEARERGITGSAEKIQGDIADGLEASRQAVIDAAKASNVEINVGLNPTRTSKELEKIGDYLSKFEGQDNADEAMKAYDIAIKASKGKLNMEDAIKARELFDRMVKYSENGNVPQSGKGEIYKSFADNLREQINKTEGLGQAMKDYRFFIRSAKPLMKAAQRETTEPVVSRLQSMYLGGMAATNPAGIIPLATEKILSRSRVATPIAQMLEKGIRNPALPTTITGTTAQVLNPNQEGIR